MSLAPVAVSLRAASLIATTSSCLPGSFNSGNDPSAWRARSQASAGSVRLSASAKAEAVMPCGPTLSARARSIECLRRMAPYVMSCLLLRGGDALRPADHRDEHATVKQALGHAFGVLERDGVDQCVALVDVVDAEIVELHAHQLVRDLARGVEAKRERAFQVGLGLVELVRRRTFLGHTGDLGLDHINRVLGGVIAGGSAADMHG